MIDKAFELTMKSLSSEGLTDNEAKYLRERFDMKVGDKVTQVGMDGTPHNEYKDWVGQIVQINKNDSIALVKWDPTYHGPGLWEPLIALKVVGDSAIVGKQQG